jgi:hypothetical protein
MPPESHLGSSSLVLVHTSNLCLFLKLDWGPMRLYSVWRWRLGGLKRTMRVDPLARLRRWSRTETRREGVEYFDRYIYICPLPIHPLMTLNSNCYYTHHSSPHRYH